MKEIAAGGLEVRIVGGTDGDGGGDGPVVVLLHGFGAPGDDLVSLWRSIAVEPPRSIRFVFPAAPLELPPSYGDGRAWWWIDLEARVRRQMMGGRAWDIAEVPEGLALAREKVIALLGEVKALLGPRDDKIVLGGFSQGAMLSLDVALHWPGALAGLVLLSGTHIAEKEWARCLASRRSAGGGGAPQAHKKTLHVFMSHGRDDLLLPFRVSEELSGTLKESGMAVEWVPFRGGHGIPPEVVAALGPFLTRCLV
jgi:phospholipase/carboxylesterase